jgi:hypothetical protein
MKSSLAAIHEELSLLSPREKALAVAVDYNDPKRVYVVPAESGDARESFNAGQDRGRAQELANSSVPRSRLSLYSSILMMVLGIVTLVAVQVLGGAILTLVGLGMYFFYRRLQRRSQSIAEGSLRNAATKAEPVVVKEKEIHVVVRIPCEHCGVLNDQLRTKCESCGAPLR